MRERKLKLFALRARNSISNRFTPLKGEDMQSSRRRLLVAAVFAAFLAPAQAETNYRLTILPCPGADTWRCSATAININGIVVGYGGDQNGGAALKWTNGMSSILAVPTGATGFPMGVNDSEQVVGWVGHQAVVWGADGTLTALGNASKYTNGFGINNTGQTVGRVYLVPPNFKSRATIWNGKSATRLPSYHAGGDAHARVIANNGWIGGNEFSLTEHWLRALIWRDMVPTDLGTLGGDTAYLTALNSNGEAVGISSDGGSKTSSFLWKDGVMKKIDDEAGSSFIANGINDSTEVVGNIYSGDDGAQLAALWREGAFLDLNSVLVAQTRRKYLLTHANSINARGQIIGVAYDRALGIERPFLLSPQ